MKKAIVIGSPGAGKSTFARKLRDMTGMPLYHLDTIWHLPDRTTISREQFDEKHSDILEKDCWIIDGNYSRTLEIRLKHCDTVFLLDYPVDVCLSGVSERIGKEREEMPWIEQEFDKEFRQYIVDFPHKRMPWIKELLGQYSEGKDIHVFHSREEADDYFKI